MLTSPLLAASDADWFVSYKEPVVPKHNSTIKPAVELLTNYLSRVLGRQVEVGPLDTSTAKVTFVITAAAHAPADVAKQLEGKRLDAFLIKYPYQLDGKNVCLLVSRDEYACDYPVYHFLTKFMDVHWVGPGELGEVFTPNPKWRMPAKIDVLEDPSFQQRMWNFGSFSCREWLGRGNRMGFHHALGIIFDPRKYAKSDPEVFPLMADGKRFIPDTSEKSGVPYVSTGGFQPCTTHPRSIEIATQAILDALTNNPQHISASLSVNDGAGNFCMCERCRALDEPDSLAPGKREYLSDRFFTFYNTITENVLPKRPEAYIAVLSYGAVLRAPRHVKVHPRIQVFHVLPTPERLDEWAPTGAGACLYLWLYDAGFLQMRPDMKMVAELARRSHATGGQGVYAEAIGFWPGSGPRFYVFSHLLWNVKRDVNELYAEYFRLAYGGKAGRHVREYYARWDEMFNRQPKEWQYSTGTTWQRPDQFKYFRRDDFEFLDKAMARAKEAPASEKEKARLGYLLTYHEWLRTNAEQVLLARELSDPEWLGKRSPEELFHAMEGGAGLTEKFKKIWDEKIATDKTGWLMDKHYQDKPDYLWNSFTVSLRMGVASLYETAVDQALNALTEKTVKSGGKDAAVAFWEKELPRHPALEGYIKPQLTALAGKTSPNLVPNGGFEEGKEGTIPQVPGWKTYVEYGMMKGSKGDYSWKNGTGHDGKHAFGLGGGDYAELRSSLSMQEGQRYSLTLWYKTENREDTPPRFRMYHYDSEIKDLTDVVYEKLTSFADFPLELTHGEWRRFSRTFTSPRSGNFLIQPLGGRLKPGEWVWFDDVEIKRIQ